MSDKTHLLNFTRACPSRIKEEEDEFEGLPIFNSDFHKGEKDQEYIRQFVKCMKRLHASDRENENARKESLGHTMIFNGHYPQSLRQTLLGKDEFYIKAMIPILRETY